MPVISWSAIPGVKQTCIQNWFGGTDPKNPRNFFAQFAVTPEFYEIYGKDARGNKVEIYFDPTDGRIVKRRGS